MKLKKSTIRVSNNSLERFRRTARVTPPIAKRAETIKGTAENKANKIGNIVLQRIPIDWRVCKNKLRLFRRNSAQSLLKKKPIGFMHCAERSNLAISLLNASKVKAWLAREMILTKNSKGEEKWHFHDYVEFYSKERGLFTLVFTAFKPSIDTYAIFKGPMENLRNSKKSLIFRGADSKQIGGIGNWKEYEKYTKKLNWDPKKEIQKDRNRIDLLAREGVIPRAALGEINL